MLALMGCTATRELAESNSDTALAEDEAAQKSQELAAACATIEATFRPDSPPNEDEVNRSYFYQAYCEDTTLDAQLAAQMPSVYCSELKRQVPDYCLQFGIPLLECVANKDTTIVAEDCADVWLGQDCDPTAKQLEPEYPLAAPDGLIATCVGGQIAGTPSGFEVILPGTGESCADGHHYQVTCSIDLSCTMLCDCRLDSKLISTAHAPRIGHNAALAACGWKP
jgi:hypothetical protein